MFPSECLSVFLQKTLHNGCTYKRIHFFKKNKNGRLIFVCFLDQICPKWIKLDPNKNFLMVAQTQNSNFVFPLENSTFRIAINECFWKRITCTLAFLAADSAFTWAGVLREGVFVGLANSSTSLWSAEADFVTGLLDFMSGCLAKIQIKTSKKVLTFTQTYTRPEVFVLSYLLCTFSSATLFFRRHPDDFFILKKSAN